MPIRCSSLTSPADREPPHRAYGRPRFATGLALLVAVLIVLPGIRTLAATDDFSPFVELAPFVVKGKALTIAVHARSRRDRRYAEQFADKVVRVIYETVTEETGKGLVIIGQKGEPHPIVVFRAFLELAERGELDPAIAAHRPEVATMLDSWKAKLGDEVDVDVEMDGEGGELGSFDFDKLVMALPLALEGIGAKLYQIAWAEKFDTAKVEARLRTLRAEDLERNDLFARYDWVFYLPARGAFDRVLDELIAAALKEEDVGFVTRMIVKGALAVVRPKIRRAIEALRQGLMFATVVEARTSYDGDIVESLTGAYVEALMPEGESVGGSDNERAVKAVRAALDRKDGEDSREGSEP